MEWAFWAALAFALALGVLNLITIFGVMLLMRGRGTGKVFRFMRLRLLFPLIIIFALLTLVVSIVFVAGAVATADWCHNGPDAKVSYLLDEYQDNVDSVIYQFARYYVNTCDSELAPIRIVTQSQLSLNITTQVSGLLSQINTFDEAVWREACGDSLTGLQVILEGLVGGLCVLGQTVEDLNRYFWCRNWNPVYGFFMHDGICQDATEGIGWIAAATFWVRTFHSLWIGKKQLLIILIRSWRFCSCFTDDFMYLCGLAPPRGSIRNRRRRRLFERSVALSGALLVHSLSVLCPPSCGVRRWHQGPSPPEIPNPFTPKKPIFDIATWEIMT